MRINEVILHEELLDVKSVITSSIKKLDKVFKSNNYELRIVGGAVRDIALGKTPKDIDLATDATPDEMIAILDKAGIKHKPTGLEHGTLTAILDSEPFEITTLRADTETDGRHAEVEFVKSWEEDAKRRDLTYNAMSMDMEGNVFDYFNGMDDLQDKVSKFVGDADERIKEDYLRILRYFRFQGRLSTPSWNDDTLKAISSNTSGLAKVSSERIWQEMSKVLSGQNVANVLDHMTKTGVSKVIGLSTNDLSKVKDNGNSIVALAQMGNTVDIAKRWRLSNNESALLDFLVKNKNNSLDQKKVEDMIADGVSKDLISALATLQGKDVNIDVEVPTFPVTGTDLIAKGMNPGPEIGAKLGQLKQKWKQSNFKATKDELLGESKVINEAVHKFMTGHGVTFGGKKHEEMEIEVTGTDDVNRKYQIMILTPKELFGKTVSVSSKYMERGPWTKTETPDVFESRIARVTLIFD
jgi:tRNA nucleotidyltransferase (CCA-adding enzyme)